MSLDGLQSPGDDASTALDSASDAASSDVVSGSDSGNDSSGDSDAPQSAIAFVQVNGDYFSVAGLSLLTPVTAGNSVVVVVANSIPGTVAVTDAQGDIFAPVIPLYRALDGASISTFVNFHMKGGTSVIDVSAPDGGSGYIYYAAEYRGISAFDLSATGSQLSSMATDALAAQVTTTGGPELVFAYAEALGNLHPGTGMNARSIFDGNVIEDVIVSTPGNYNMTATMNGGPGDIVVLSFK